MAAAINKAKSTDVSAVRTALAGLETDTVLGKVEVRAADHQTVRPIAVTQIVTGADGKPAYEIKEIEGRPRHYSARQVRLQDVSDSTAAFRGRSIDEGSGSRTARRGRRGVARLS